MSEAALKVALKLDGRSVPEAYLRRIKQNAEQEFCYVKRSGQYETITWKQLHHLVLGTSSGLRSQGLKAGDRVAILSQSVPEWNAVDLATLCSGAVTVPIYPSLLAKEIAYILKDCGATFLFVENETQYAKAVEALKELGKKLPLICFSDSFHEIEGYEVVSFKAFSRLTDKNRAQSDLEAVCQSIEPETLASIVYTSGTTGVPKGVMLSHSNFTDTLRAAVVQVDIEATDCLLTFLPFSHIFGRVESFAPIFCGVKLAFAENIASIPQNILEIRPTYLISVPRIYEKIFAKIQTQVNSTSPQKQKLFWWAVDIGKQVVQLKSENKPVPMVLELKYQVAKRLVLHKISDKMGGKIRLTVSGGAPLNTDLCKFFHACGVRIMEGYGLTETTGPIIANAPEDYRFGTVGKPLQGAEMKIASDGEILLRGPMVFKGYYNNPKATKEVLTEDGWFHSGDIGEIDDRGFLKITDRKKEILVTAGGKNVAPQKLENLLKNAPYISNSIIIGDKQKYLTALITINEEELGQAVKDKGGQFSGVQQLCEHPEALELIQHQVDQINKELASFETIKKFRLLPIDFSIETGELTPSLKLKRRVILEKHKEKIDEMYS